MKKILMTIFFLYTIISFNSIQVYTAWEDYTLNDMNAWSEYDTTEQAEARESNECDGDVNEYTNLSQKIGDCMNSTQLIEVNWKATIKWAFKDKINSWTNNIALFLGILAVGSVVYGGLMMTLSAWEDERIKKAKDMVKWGLVGFLGVVMATTIVTLVINIMYWFAA